MAADFIEEALKKRGVDTRCIDRFASFRTPSSAIFVDKEGERLIVNDRGPFPQVSAKGAADALAPYKDNLGALPDLLLVDSRWPSEANRLSQAAFSGGIPVVFDAEPPLDGLDPALSAASHIVFPEHGLRAVSPQADPRAALAEAWERWDGFVAVTRGREPIATFDGQRYQEFACPEVQQINTLGAGDFWHGAFALFLAEDLEEGAAASRANLFAALAVRREQYSTPLPSRSQVENFM